MPLLCHSDATGTLLVADRDNFRLQLLHRGGQWQLTQVTLPRNMRCERAVYTPGRLYVLGVSPLLDPEEIYLYEPAH